MKHYPAAGTPPNILESFTRSEIELLRDFAEAIETVYHPAYDSTPECREAISSIIAPKIWIILANGGRG